MFPKFIKILACLTGFFLSLSFVSQTPFLPQKGVIDLDNLDNYARQAVPSYITKDNTPADNEITDAGATLGRVLFYDRKLSVDNTISCGSCHRQEHAFSDPDHVSKGVAGVTGRRSMRLINTRFAEESKFFWDERASSLEALTTMPIQDHVEMGFSGLDGNPGLDSLLRKLETVDYYRTLFTYAFGDGEVNEGRIQKAMAQFIRSIQSFDAPYDAGRKLVETNTDDFPNFTEQENIGKWLFIMSPVFDATGRRVSGGAGCASCHRPPEFDIDPESGNNGMVRVFGSDTETDETVTRSPTLRDVCNANGRPYGGFMHNSSMGEPVVVYDVTKHYNEEIPLVVNPGIDSRLLPGGQPQQLMLSVPERKALGVFVRTLKGTNVYEDPKWSDPFDTAGNLIIKQGVTSTHSTYADEDIVLYPNPAHSELYLKTSLQYTHIEILDLQGRRLRTITNDQTGRRSLYVGDLASGAYLIGLINVDSGQRYFLKIVKD